MTMTDNPQGTGSRTRSPCVGICSTTFGDLVCRGCKRFAHEIVQWNGFEDAQKHAVLVRLDGIRGACVTEKLVVADEVLLRERAAHYRVPEAEQLDAPNLGYEVLRRIAVQGLSLDSAGLAASGEARTLLAEIDAEYYRRAVAWYERSYKISMTDQ